MWRAQGKVTRGGTVLSTPLERVRFCEVLAGHLKRGSVGYPAFAGRERSLIQQFRELLAYESKRQVAFSNIRPQIPFI